jgi:hypothetical protein
MTSSVSPAPWRPLLRTLCATAGRSAAQQALPLYLGVWIIANVLMEGNGVRPADVTARLTASVEDRALAYAVWSIVSMPAIRALLATPSSYFLRTLPVPRWQLLVCLAAGLLLAELPWAYLWLRGGGLGLGLAHVAAALGCTTLLLSRLARRSEALAAALLLLGLAFATSWLPLLMVSLPAAALGARAVWLRAPEPRSSAGRSWIGRSPALALATCHCLVLWRRARAQLARSLVFTLLALLVSHFAIRNNPPASATVLLAWALAALGPALLLAAASLVGPLLQAEAQLGWLLAVCGTPAAAWRVAGLAPLAVFGAALATLHAVVLGATLALPPGLRAWLWLSELLAALLLGLLALAIARWAVRGDGNDSGRLVLGMGLASISSTAVLLWLGLPALSLWACAALLAWFEPWAARRPALALRNRLER